MNSSTLALLMLSGGLGGMGRLGVPSAPRKKTPAELDQERLEAEERAIAKRQEIAEKRARRAELRERRKRRSKKPTKAQRRGHR